MAVLCGFEAYNGGMDEKKSIRDTFKIKADHTGRNAGITFCGTMGAGYLGMTFVQAAAPAMMAMRGETSALGFTAGAIMGFLILATALKL